MWTPWNQPCLLGCFFLWFGQFAAGPPYSAPWPGLWQSCSWARSRLMPSTRFWWARWTGNDVVTSAGWWLGSSTLTRLDKVPSGKLTWLWKITRFNGKIHYFYDHFQYLCNKLPEGNSYWTSIPSSMIFLNFSLMMPHGPYVSLPEGNSSELPLTSIFVLKVAAHTYTHTHIYIYGLIMINHC